MIERELVPLVAARFKALGEPGRLEVLQLLFPGEKSVGELAEATGRSQPNISQHLASLTQAGLVEPRREGNRTYYSVTDPYLARICDAVCASLEASARKTQRQLRPLERGNVARAGRRRG